MIPLRILITADPYLPVPPRLYGGIERIVDLLVRGLVARGHAITLFAHKDSATAGSLVPYGRPPHMGVVRRLAAPTELALRLLRHVRQADVVHSFGRLAALLPLLPMRRLPKIQSYQRAIPWRGVGRAATLAGQSLCFTSCSDAQRASGWSTERPGRWVTIHNAVDTARIRWTEAVAPDAPLAFLGRLEFIKGVHHAIRIARRAGRRLVIAGNRVEEGSARGYFEAEIAPHLDGQAVRYLGPVDDLGKQELLTSAAALLMPLEIDEAFGIVMAEAFACGTPVIGFPRGSLPELVLEGQNGFVCPDVETAAAAVARLGLIDRCRVRRDAEERFDAVFMVDRYERLYREMLDRTGR